MSEPDPIALLLKELDQPAVPRPEFTATLRSRLLAEFGEATDHPRERRRAPQLRRALFARHRRPMLAAALACVIAATAVVAVVLSRPSPASALDVIQLARKAFAAAPPFEATLRVELNPDGSNVGVPRGATATVLMSYGGPGRFRTQITAVKPRFPGSASPGSYQVFNRRTIAVFDSQMKQFNSGPAPRGFRPLDYFSWRGAFPDWERICQYPGSKVLPDGRIAGRDARHIVCNAYTGDTWQLWIDKKTGLMLKVVGQVAGDDFFLNLGSGGTSKGGFQVEHLRLRPSFPAGTFSVSSPPGVTDYQAGLRAAAARVPPFRAVVSGRSRGKSYVEEVWWLNSLTWRVKVLAGYVPGLGLRGAGSFAVSAQGSPVASYNADDNSYSRSDLSPSANPVFDLLPAGAVYDYSTAGCPIIGSGRIARRDVVHRRCPSSDIWVDRSSGLLLRRRSPGYERRVRSIEYRPLFSPGTFRFVIPAGSRSEQQLENDPYYKTALAAGKLAPPWQAAMLGGGTFRLTDLRGKPALLLLFSDSCPAGDPACDVFRQLEQSYEEAKGKVAILWVDFQGNAGEARKIVRHNHLTFPVVFDARGASLKAWKIQSYPYWLLVNSRGRVIEARLKPQTVTQIKQLLAKAK
ncbi:MAG: redoxin domain-containing protein [Streptosporangiaceae bacterium]